MIDRKEGLIFVPTKRDKSLIIPIDKSQEVKILDDHSICFVRFRRTSGRRKILDVTWHFYEEINEKSHPWHGKVRYNLDSETRKSRENLAITPKS